MEKSKRAKLTKAGYTVCDTQEFLGLSDAEMEYIELKRLLSHRLSEARKKQGITQKEAAQQLHTSQTRYSRMEAAGHEVTIDRIIQGCFNLGVTRKELRRVI